jgi:VIT1/CCC1 family predicted Fe2+/Mn2+ transporter
MDATERADAIFGMFDGTVSIIGFIFGLLVHGSPESAIVVGGLGGAISATVSMGTGDYEESDGSTGYRLRRALTMGLFTMIGSMVPILPFVFLGKHAAILVAGVGCLLVAGWIGYEKRKGVRGWVEAYLTVLGAAGLTLAIVSFIPASVGG